MTFVKLKDHFFISNLNLVLDLETSITSLNLRIKNLQDFFKSNKSMHVGYFEDQKQRYFKVPLFLVLEA